jgi:hypothetical protein
MDASPLPQLDLAALLAARSFTADDLAHNRRGSLSPAQEAWRAANPKFMDDDKEANAVETLVGRVAIEGKYLAGRMGEIAWRCSRTP